MKKSLNLQKEKYTNNETLLNKRVQKDTLKSKQNKMQDSPVVYLRTWNSYDNLM